MIQNGCAHWHKLLENSSRHWTLNEILVLKMIMVLFHQCRSAAHFSDSDLYKIEVRQEADHRVIRRCFRGSDDFEKTWKKICQWQKERGLLGIATLSCGSQVIEQQRFTMPTAQSSNRERKEPMLYHQKKQVRRALKFT